MTQNTMTEREGLIAHFDREYETTLRLLKAFPPAKSDLRPSEKSKTALELAWMLTLNQMVVQPTLAGSLDRNALPQMPKTWNEVLAAFEKAHRESAAWLADLTEEQMNRTITIPSGPGKVREMRIADALWFFFYDSIHHRGQFSVYARMAGAKVPSIYGPTADEKWS